MSLISNIKIRIKLLLRAIKDLLNGHYFYFSKKRRNINFAYKLRLNQDIKPSATFENKHFNLSLASKRINKYTLMPGEIFSFWRVVGNPNKNFKKSRSIIGGEVSEDSGGGLCQVSGLIYYGSLKGGLEILERYNHSLDLYTEDTRFTPLGTDATVVYGYKDLRIKNPYTFPIKFNIKVHANSIDLELLSTENITEQKLKIEQKCENNRILVDVYNSNNQILNRSIYQKLK